jgi:DNA-binding transcriptional LysR family regulator
VSQPRTTSRGLQRKAAATPLVSGVTATVGSLSILRLAAKGTWSSIELRDLRVFLTLADELHFGRTADQLGVTHSRVSQTIRLLETRMNARLFDRSSRRVRLTEAGQQLRDRIAPALVQIQNAYAELSEFTNGVVGTLRLGIQAHAFVGLEPTVEIVRRFERSHPRCVVRVTEIGASQHPFEGLRRDELDMMLARLPISDPDLIVGPTVATEGRVLAVAPDHPLAARSSVCVEDLADYTTTDTDFMPRELIDAASPPQTRAGRSIKRLKVASIAETAVRVATGELVHPTVPSFFKRFSHFGLVAVPITDLPMSSCALIWRRTNASLKIAAFAKAASDLVQIGETHPSGTDAAVAS